MEHPHIRTTWIWVAVVVGAITLGYILTMLLRGDAAIAQPVRCPMQEETCARGDCANHAACQYGACSSDCPGNCGKRE